MLLAPAHFEPIFRHFIAIKSNFMTVRHELKLSTTFPETCIIQDTRIYLQVPSAFEWFYTLILGLSYLTLLVASHFTIENCNFLQFLL